MNLVQRITDILLKPKDTWPTIAQEPADVASIYSRYLVFLAAIPAIAGFIGFSLVGMNTFGVSFRLPITTGLVNMVVSYVLSLVMVFVLALIVDALAPSFGGSKNQVNALKVVAYSLTAALVGGVFSLLPALAMLGLLAALYSVYLLYTGLPVLMKCPQDKSLGYTAVVVVCGIVAGIAVGVVSALFTPHPAMTMGQIGGAPAGEISINTPTGTVKLDAQKMKDAQTRMEDISKRLQAAQASGDKEATAKAMREMMEVMAASGLAGGVNSAATPGKP
ncbi:MAG: YIP1 family protein [Burkholderiales bacterium]